MQHPVHGEMLQVVQERLALRRGLARAGLVGEGDIAAMGALLMSDDGSFITGQTFAVDGGLTMRA